MFLFINPERADAVAEWRGFISVAVCLCIILISCGNTGFARKRGTNDGQMRSLLGRPWNYPYQERARRQIIEFLEGAIRTLSIEIAGTCVYQRCFRNPAILCHHNIIGSIPPALWPLHRRRDLRPVAALRRACSGPAARRPAVSYLR